MEKNCFQVEELFKVLKIGDTVVNKITGEIGKVFDHNQESECVFVHVEDFNFEQWNIRNIESKKIC